LCEITFEGIEFIEFWGKIGDGGGKLEFWEVVEDIEIKYGDIGECTDEFHVLWDYLMLESEFSYELMHSWQL
jgi:hypothetical protein